MHLECINSLLFKLSISDINFCKWDVDLRCPPPLEMLHQNLVLVTS